MNAADQIQLDRLQAGEAGSASVHPSGRRFHFGDGGGDATESSITQPVTSGLLKGSDLELHLVDKDNNQTPPLLGIDTMKAKKMIVDFETGKCLFKDDPSRQWHQLPRTERGLLLMPLTAEANARYGISDREEASLCGCCECECDIP